MRRGATWRRMVSTVPSRATPTTSIGNRMPKVWMPCDGAMTIAWPSGNRSRPASPLRRAAEVPASSPVVASHLPVRADCNPQADRPW